MEELIGKEVVIYPTDTYQKRGIILEIVSNAGILFEITYYNGKDSAWVVGKQQFVSYSANLSFREY